MEDELLLDGEPYYAIALRIALSEMDAFDQWSKEVLNRVYGDDATLRNYRRDFKDGYRVDMTLGITITCRSANEAMLIKLAWLNR